MRKKSVLAVSSGGGHWVQLLRLMPAFSDCDVAFATVSETYQPDVAEARFHLLNDATRWNRTGLVALAVRVLWIVLRERPDVVVSTGAAPGLFALAFGKLTGSRTIWVDSMANADKLSLSGTAVRPFADLLLTQWPHLERPNGPHFKGSLI